MAVSSSSSGVFVWGHVFQRGDLPLFVTDFSGNPVGPYKVTYTMYFHPSNAACGFRVGPEDRTPVNVGTGEYYATGIAGQCGQPGTWCVVWKVQEVFEGPVISDKFCFQVFDASQYCPPGGGSQSCPSTNTPACGCRRPCSCTCKKSGW